MAGTKRHPPAHTITAMSDSGRTIDGRIKVMADYFVRRVATYPGERCLQAFPGP